MGCGCAKRGTAIKIAAGALARGNVAGAAKLGAMVVRSGAADASKALARAKLSAGAKVKR